MHTFLTWSRLSHHAPAKANSRRIQSSSANTLGCWIIYRMSHQNTMNLWYKVSLRRRLKNVLMGSNVDAAFLRHHLYVFI